MRTLHSEWASRLAETPLSGESWLRRSCGWSGMDWAEQRGNQHIGVFRCENDGAESDPPCPAEAGPRPPPRRHLPVVTSRSSLPPAPSRLHLSDHAGVRRVSRWWAVARPARCLLRSLFHFPQLWSGDHNHCSQNVPRIKRSSGGPYKERSGCSFASDVANSRRPPVSGSQEVCPCPVPPPLAGRDKVLSSTWEATTLYRQEESPAQSTAQKPRFKKTCHLTAIWLESSQY